MSDMEGFLEAQIERLLDLGYSHLLGCAPSELRSRLSALEEHIPPDARVLDVGAGTIGAVLVVKAPAKEALGLVKRKGKPAIEALYPRDIDFFKPLPGLDLPAGQAYLLLDVDRGNDTLNLAPVAAQEQLASRGRLPLTLEEGVAVLTQAPEFLQPNRCFMMLGSRGDDKRVPALWLSSGQPKLGWCWQGNPHTWLGFASCRARSPAVEIPVRH